MKEAANLKELRKIAEEVSAREGCTLYDIEFVGLGGGRTLRVFIDKDGDGGVTLDDCANVSRALNLRLDVEDIVPGGPYHLEVSSPGLERSLKEGWHFEQAVGKKVLIKSRAPLVEFNQHLPELGKLKQIKGELRSFESGGVKVEWEGAKEVFVPVGSIAKAHLTFEMDCRDERDRRGR